MKQSRSQSSSQSSILKSRSMDSSSQQIKHDMQSSKATVTDHSIKQDHNNRNSSFSEQEQENGEVFGVILRSYSVSSSASLALRAEKQNSVLEKAVRKTLSLRRSPSIPEGHYGIFHQFDAVDDEGVKARRSKNKRGNIFKACRRILGF